MTINGRHFEPYEVADEAWVPRGCPSPVHGNDPECTCPDEDDDPRPDPFDVDPRDVLAPGCCDVPGCFCQDQYRRSV